MVLWLRCSFCHQVKKGVFYGDTSQSEIFAYSSDRDLGIVDEVICKACKLKNPHLTFSAYPLLA